MDRILEDGDYDELIRYVDALEERERTRVYWLRKATWRIAGLKAVGSDQAATEDQVWWLPSDEPLHDEIFQPEFIQNVAPAWDILDDKVTQDSE